MRRVRSALTAALAAFAFVGAAAAPAVAASGEVSVFETELNPLSTYENPAGCHKLPPAAHVLSNRTDQPVRIYGDPFCMGASLTVQPGYGAHVASGSGSFSV